MVAMDVFQRITVQGTVNSEDHVTYVRITWITWLTLLGLHYITWLTWITLTGLHGLKPKKEGVKQDSGNGGNKQITTICTCVKSLSCAFTKFRSDVISMCVVPVHIRHPDSSKVFDTYATLDNCSQGTFLKEEMIEALRITGAETRETVKILNGEVSQMTTVVENLKVAGSLGKPEWIKLPRAYTK